MSRSMNDIIHQQRSAASTRLAAALLLAGTSFACAQQLEPASTGGEGAAQAAATDKAAGVRAVAKLDAWSGSDNVTRQIAPVRVYLVNESGEEVSISQADIALVGEQNERIYPLDPQKARLIPTTSADPLLAGEEEAQMQRGALPDKTLSSGQAANGYLYFNVQGTKKEPVYLEIPVRREPAGEPLTTLRIPFEIR